MGKIKALPAGRLLAHCTAGNAFILPIAVGPLLLCAIAGKETNRIAIAANVVMVLLI